MGHRIQFRSVFDVTISSEARRILAVLSKNPLEIFNRPYLGYILLLIPDVDQKAYSWLRNHAMAMDSLSGADIGIGIFSARIPLHTEAITQSEVAVSRSRQPSSPHGNLCHWEVRELIESGRIQFSEAPTDQELFAVNEAVSEVARNLGVTQHLPCIVALDGLPHPELPWLCVPMNDASISRLFSAIRVAIGVLQSQVGLPEYREGIQKLADLPRRLRIARDEEVGWRQKILHQHRKIAIQSKQVTCSYADGLRQCRNAVSRGQRRHYRLLVEGLARHYPTLQIDVSRVTEVSWDKLTRYRKTMHMLGRYADKLWPLPPDAHERLRHITSHHARELMGNPSISGTLESQGEIEALRKQLLDLWTDEVNEVMDRLPAPSETMVNEDVQQEEILETMRRELAEFQEHLCQASEAVRSTEMCIVETSRRLLDLPGRPSFCQLLQRECLRSAIQTHPELLRPLDGNPRPVPSFWTSWLPASRLIKWICDRSFQRLPADGIPIAD